MPHDAGIAPLRELSWAEKDAKAHLSRLVRERDMVGDRTPHRTDFEEFVQRSATGLAAFVSPRPVLLRLKRRHDGQIVRDFQFLDGSISPQRTDSCINHSTTVVASQSPWE